MRTKELYQFLCENVESGEDLALSIHHGNYAGQIQNISERADRIIISNEYNPRESHPDNLTEALIDLLSDFLDEDLEVIVRVPSMGFFRIKEVKREHYEWEDDAPYDTIDIFCEDEPFCGGSLDDLRHYVRNHNIAEQYEDYDEGKKVENNQLFENILRESSDGHHMTVGELKAALADCDDDKEVRMYVFAPHTALSGGCQACGYIEGVGSEYGNIELYAYENN